MYLRTKYAASFVREKVLRVFTFGSPPVVALKASRTVNKRNDSQSHTGCTSECSVLIACGLPSSLVYGFVQPWVSVCVCVCHKERTKTNRNSSLMPSVFPDTPGSFRSFVLRNRSFQANAEIIGQRWRDSDNAWTTASCHHPQSSSVVVGTGRIVSTHRL